MSRLKVRSDFLPYARPHIDKKELRIINEVVRSGWWTTGDMVSMFEEKLSLYVKEGFEEDIYAVALDSCTSALYLSLISLGIGEGDEVIVPTWTFIAAAHVVEWVGARLVLCDIEESSLNIDIEKVRGLITERTRAIIVVHFGGYPCDMDGFLSLSREYGIEIIEDAAHAIGTRYYDKRVGQFSDYTCFSFYVTKNLAMAEGGALLTTSYAIEKKIRSLSYFGIDRDAFSRYKSGGEWFYDVSSMGFKCNMDNLNAALGVVQLNKLDKMNERRRFIASLYREHLDSNVRCFIDSSEHYHSCHLFPIRVPLIIVSRDDFISQLRDRNIGSSVHFIPLHLHSYYASRFELSFFECANRVFEEVVSLPLYPSMSDDDVYYVIEHVNDIIRLGG